MASSTETQYTETALPILYTLTSTKMIRYWLIKAISDNEGVYIYREYGKLGGKAIPNKKFISDSKSKQDLFQQALFQAKSAWQEMKEKKGYVIDQKLLTNTMEQLMSNQETNNQETNNQEPKDKNKKISVNSSTSQQETKENKIPIKIRAKNENNVEVINHIDDQYKSFKFLPMLANKFSERKHHVKYPCYGQPKLDGVRYTSRKISNDEIIMKTRNDGTCPFFQEIKSALNQLNLTPGILLDGEFYSKKIPFRTLNGYCNRKKIDGKTGYSLIPKDHIESIHYYIFDCYFIDCPKKIYKERFEYLQQLLSANTSKYIKLVPKNIIEKEEDIKTMHDIFVADGNEGLMIRNITGIYKLKDRSNDLLKYKEFQDEEYKIVGAECSLNGKEEGCIIWILGLMDNTLTFTCRPRDTHESRRNDWLEYNQNCKKYIGQLYTVRFQEKYENGIPRFPVGIAIRYDL